MGTQLTDLQKSILMYIHENNYSYNWVPIEPDVFEGQSLMTLAMTCKELEEQALLEMDYPGSALYAIRPGGERVRMINPKDWLLCAITVEGIQAIETG